MEFAEQRPQRFFILEHIQAQPQEVIILKKNTKHFGLEYGQAAITHGRMRMGFISALKSQSDYHLILDCRCDKYRKTSN
jgi:hypothetical protein